MSSFEEQRGNNDAKERTVVTGVVGDGTDQTLGGCLSYSTRARPGLPVWRICYAM